MSRSCALAADDKRLRTALHYEIATGLSRPDVFDWPTTLVGDAAALHPEVTLLMFGGNDAQGIVGPDGEVFAARRLGRAGAPSTGAGWAP